MSEEKTSGSISNVVKSIADIAASAAAVMGYIQGIFKIADTPYPNTVSLVLILLTFSGVVSSLWGKLNQKKKKTPTNGNAKKPARGSFLERLLEPIKASKVDPYVQSLTKRRVEAGFIAVLTVFTFGWSGFNISGVVTELTTDPSLTCSYGEGEEKLLIVVADVLETGEQELLVSDKIYEELVNNQAGNLYDVCRLSETFKVNTHALDKAKELEAEIVIWGRKDLIYEIHLEAPAFTDPDRKVSVLATEEATSVEFQIKEPTHIAYVAEFALSELLLLNGRVTEAQARLQDAINRAEADALHPQDLAEGYYLLGILYDPRNSDFSDAKKAVDAYGAAESLDEEQFAARLNRGLILSDMGRVEEAIAEYTFLIDHDTPLKGSALVNRAFLQTDPQARIRDFEAAIEFDPAEGYFFLGVEYMDQKDYQTAIKNFEKAVEYDPQFYANYHLLGLNQLYAGEYEEAKKTYTRMIPYLTSEEDRSQVIQELQDKAAADLKIQPTVEEIIQSLRAARLP